MIKTKKGMMSLKIGLALLALAVLAVLFVMLSNSSFSMSVLLKTLF